MKRISAAVGLMVLVLCVSSTIRAGTWSALTSLSTISANKTTQLRQAPNIQAQVCRAPTLYSWNGQCRTCTSPSSQGLEGTGYLRCEEGFCLRGGAAAVGSVLGDAREADVRDCATVPRASNSPATETHFGLATDEYTIGTIAMSYEGEQLASLKCDPGQVAVGIKVRADSMIRSVTELDCKPVNALSSANVISKLPSTPLGNPSGNETTARSPDGFALVGFDSRYVNSAEFDNRLGELVVLSPVRLDHRVGAASVRIFPGEDRGLAKFGTSEYASAGDVSVPSNPWIRTACQDAFAMTGVWVLYDGDSVKSVTPACRRVFLPGERPMTVADGNLGLIMNGEVGYLAGRTVSNAVIMGRQFDQIGTPDKMCRPGKVMVGWNIEQTSSFGYISYLYDIYCQDVNAALANCTQESPLLNGPPDRPGSEPSGTAPPNDDYGREGCAMIGFEYKQQKLRGAQIGNGLEQPADSQVISELHSLVRGLGEDQGELQGRNVGAGSNASYCYPHSTYNCNASDWFSVRCPPGSFMVGIKKMDGAGALANLGAYCSEVVKGPWTEGSNPAPILFDHLNPGALNSTAPIRAILPTQ